MILILFLLSTLFYNCNCASLCSLTEFNSLQEATCPVGCTCSFTYSECSINELQAGDKCPGTCFGAMKDGGFNAKFVDSYCSETAGSFCFSTGGYLDTCNCKVPISYSCDTCKPGYYGNSCNACPSCVKGKCSDGKAGSGQCVCEANYSGALCDNCDVCSSCCQRGKCSGNTCVCEEGFQGSDCSRCLPGHFGKDCQKCDCANGDCDQGINGKGCVCRGKWSGQKCDLCTCKNSNCDEQGNCGKCLNGWTGPGCSLCLPPYGGPNCTCNCDPVGGSCVVSLDLFTCNCREGFKGLLCDECESGHFGSDCIPCSCPDSNQKCSEGRTGSGKCQNKVTITSQLTKTAIIGISVGGGVLVAIAVVVAIAVIIKKRN